MTTNYKLLIPKNLLFSSPLNSFLFRLLLFSIFHFISFIFPPFFPTFLFFSLSFFLLYLFLLSFLLFLDFLPFFFFFFIDKNILLPQASFREKIRKEGIIEDVVGFLRKGENELRTLCANAIFKVRNTNSAKHASLRTV